LSHCGLADTVLYCDAQLWQQSIAPSQPRDPKTKRKHITLHAVLTVILVSSLGTVVHFQPISISNP
jgi:hypothetical protein